MASSFRSSQVTMSSSEAIPGAPTFLEEVDKPQPLAVDYLGDQPTMQISHKAIKDLFLGELQPLLLPQVAFLGKAIQDINSKTQGCLVIPRINSQQVSKILVKIMIL